MTKIKSLTPEQEKQLPIDRERFRAIGIRTGHDLSCVARGNAAIFDARKEIGAAPPKAIIWARSPAEALRFGHELKRLVDPKLHEATSKDLRDVWSQWSWGQTEQYWLGWYRFAIDRVGVKVTEEQERRLTIRERIAESCYGVITLNAVEIAIQHPTVAAFDDQRRLHRVDGPALAWADGYGVFMVHGIRLTVELGRKMAAKTITATEIRDEANAEIRRVLVAEYNQGDSGRYLRDIGATVIHADVDALGLPRRLLRIEQPGDEPFVAIEVTNSTPEPDGKNKLYTFRCHPELRPLPVPGVRKEYGEPQAMTCQNAIASTYGFTGDEFGLEVQT